MFDFPYPTFFGIILAFIFLSTIMYWVRVKYIRRNFITHPMGVVVVTQPHQPQYPQTCRTVSVEQPPPPYHTVITEANTNYNTLHANNGT
jgi:hypothetical protein